jgi:hypothetical protein
MMAAADSSEALVTTYQSTRRSIPDGRDFPTSNWFLPYYLSVFARHFYDTSFLFFSCFVVRVFLLCAYIPSSINKGLCAFMQYISMPSPVQR